MTYWNGIGVLKYGTSTEAINFSVYLDSDLDLNITTDHDFGFGALLLGQREDITIEIPGVALPVGVSVVQANLSSGGENRTVFRPLRVPILRSSGREMVRGRAVLVNFGSKERGLLNSRRFMLTSSEWALDLIPAGENLNFLPSLGGPRYQATHQLEFRKRDGGAFTSAQFIQFLQHNAEFFSFCQGGWIAIALATGLDTSGLVVDEEWGVGRINDFDEPDSFLDPLRVDGMSELYPLFMKRFDDDDWADTISHVIYWLRRSSVDNSGPDGGIILLQATLERFAWHSIVRDQRAISERGFSELAAADQLRLLMSMLALPKEIPAGLEELTKFANANGLDAAEAFTRVRNRIVHPPKLRAAKERLPFYDTYRLGRWLTELAVLAACEYMGEYSNRTRRNPYAGQVEKVPWSN